MLHIECQTGFNSPHNTNVYSPATQTRAVSLYIAHRLQFVEPFVGANRNELVFLQINTCSNNQNQNKTKNQIEINQGQRTRKPPRVVVELGPVPVLGR